MMDLGLFQVGKEEESVEVPKGNGEGWQRAAWQVLQICWGRRSRQDWEDSTRPESEISQVAQFPVQSGDGVAFS